MKITALAQLVRLYAECRGVTSTAKLAELTGYSERSIWKAKAELRDSEAGCTLNPSSVNHSSVHPEPECTNPEPECSPLACAHDAPELFEEIKNPIVPKNSREHGTNPRANGTNPRAKRKQPRLIEPERFDEFWNVYPRKIGKGQARNAWAKAVGKVEDAQTIVDGAKAQAKTLASKGEFCPHPSTWLNGERWADETAINGRAKLTDEQLANMTQADVIRMMRAH